MRYKTIIKLALLCWSLAGVVVAVPAVAGDVYVIAHPGFGVGAEELRDIYLGEKQFSGSTKVVPVDNAAAQSDFLAKALTIGASKYAALWVKKGFRGAMAAPLVMSGDAEVINYVKITPGAIGYVNAAGHPGVKYLFKY